MALFKKLKAAVKKDVGKVASVAKSAAKAVVKVDKAVVKVDKAIVKEVGKVATVVAKDTAVAAKAVAKEAVKVGKALYNLNPLGELLRNGMLLLMKINLFKVASRLKYGYLTDAEAAAAGIDVSKLNEVRKVLVTLQKAFYDAGGGGLKMDRTVSNNNIKNAILKGTGNNSKNGLKVSGDGSPTSGGVPTSFIGSDFIGSGGSSFIGDSPANYIGMGSYFSGANDYSNVAGVDDAAEATATAGVTALGTTLTKIGDIVSKASKIAGDAKSAVSSISPTASQASDDFANPPATTGDEAQAEIQRGKDAESQLAIESSSQLSKSPTELFIQNNKVYLIIGGVSILIIVTALIYKYKFMKG